MYFYSKTNQMHNISNLFYFGDKTLHVSGGLSVHHKESKTVHTASGVCHKDRPKHVECCFRNKINLRYCASYWTLQAMDQKQLENFEMWCWLRMEKISWTDHVRNEDVLLRVKEQKNILHEIRKRKANWIGHILRRNCLLQRVIEGKIQGGVRSDRKTRKKT